MAEIIFYKDTIGVVTFSLSGDLTDQAEIESFLNEAVVTIFN